MQSPHVLLLAKRFSRDGRNPWLLDELAGELRQRGCRVSVILLDLKSQWDRGWHILPNGVRVYAFPLSTSGNANSIRGLFWFCIKWPISLIRARRLIKDRVDIVINFSIASIFWGCVRFWRRKQLVRYSLLVLWDFFPIHQIEIGRLKKGLLTRLFYIAEHKEISCYAQIGVMSAANAAYLERYHGVSGDRVLEIPVWGASVGSEITENSTPSSDKKDFIVIFGGQLAKGRGVEQILKLCRDQANLMDGIVFWIAGDGPDRANLEIKAKEWHLRNVKFLGHLERNNYLRILRTCSAGLVVTVPGVSIPSFPSKIIDYMRAELPVIACVEESTDFGKYVEDVYQCGLACVSGDQNGLRDAILFLRDNPVRATEMGQNAFRAFEARHSVTKVVDTILSHAKY